MQVNLSFECKNRMRLTAGRSISDVPLWIKNHIRRPAKWPELRKKVDPVFVCIKSERIDYHAGTKLCEE